MIDYSTLQGLAIPEGVVTQITDESGRVLWSSGKSVILEVEKITSNTYAGETLYENEEFILLDIYPKPNRTVRVTYGGLTKTITDTSGAENPNAQKVFFGTFNGITDSVATPTSGTLMIEGGYYAFAISPFIHSDKGISTRKGCITAVKNWGSLKDIAPGMFYGCANLTNIQIPDGIADIPIDAFNSCTNLTNIQIPNSITSIGMRAFQDCTSLESVTFAKGSKLTSIGESAFKHCGNLELLVIPEGVTSIDSNAFYMDGERESDGFGESEAKVPITVMKDDVITLPSTIQSIGGSVWSYISIGNTYAYIEGIILLATTPPNISESTIKSIHNITVPKGCGEIYKNAPVWSNYANIIVEET